MRRAIKLTYWIGILVLCGLYGLYNYYFLRQDTNNALVEKVNPVPYVLHFQANQNQPNTFFTAAAFPEYTKRCHSNKKLCSIMPMQQLYADLQWIGSIQFIGGQGPKDQHLQLASLLDNLTTLSPYWNYPYVFGELIIPLQKTTAGSKEDVAIQQKSWKDAHELAIKGELYTCDLSKIAAIEKLNESDFVRIVYNTGLKQEYLNPCPTYERAHYAAFNAFYYRGDALDSARNYKISAFTEGSPGLTPIMAALVYGRGGEHLKAANLRYDRYTNIIESSPEEGILQNDADRALKKAVFELQLQIITDADETSKDVCNKSYDCLVAAGNIKSEIDNLQGQCRDKGNQQTITCGLLNIGLKQKWISLGGNLVYPIDKTYIFAWNTDYNSRWIREK